MFEKSICKRVLRPLALASLLLACMPAAAGPLFAPGTRLFVLNTERFEIIFSERSRPSALHLATFADAVYDEVAGKLETGTASRAAARIPVVITPDIGSFNGYMQPLPYPHIVLFDTSLDLGWTSFDDAFRGLFVHELTHAVSLKIRAPWADFLSGIFGSWVLPGILNTPAFMVEGVTVSFESADGRTGRASDPLVRQRVRQDIRENRFKTPIEASGLYDEYPNGTIFYEYGGLFSAYLQKAYGMEKYAALWKAMGQLILPTSLDPYEVGFYKAFRKTYGRPLLKAWADFRDSLALSGLVDPPEILGPDRLSWLAEGLTGNDDYLYWSDLRSGRAMRMDLATGKEEFLFDALGDSISDVSPDGKRLLVSRAIGLPDGRDRIETIDFDLERRRFDPATAIAGMREARFFRGGRVGIVPKLHNTDLVWAAEAGVRPLLLGSEGLMFSSPAVLDDSRIALIVAIGGIRHLGILDVDSGRLSLVKTEGAEAELFAYVRQLSSAKGKLYFNYNSDDRFYKLGLVDFAAADPAIRLETTDFSGGVLWPREAGGRVYYVGRFSEGERICRYPGEAAALGARSVAFSLVPFEPGYLEPADSSPGLGAEVASIRPYSPLAYANPFGMWYPYPDIATIDRSLRIFGRFVMQDPIDTNTLTLDLGYDSAHPFADARLAWVASELPVQLSTELGDNLVYGSAGAPERQSSIAVSGALRLPSYPSQRAAVFGLGGKAFARGRGEEGSPYAWGYSGWNATAFASLGWEGMLRGAAESSSRGFELTSYHDLDLASLAYKAEAHSVAALDRPALRLDLWGAWASAPLLSLDSSSPVFSGDRRPAFDEYASLRAGRASWLAEGSLTARLVDLPIHSNLLGLYFNRLLIDSGLRGAYFRGEFLPSAFARVSLDLGAAAGLAAGSLRAFGEGFARLSAADRDRAFGWRLGIDWNGEGSAWLR